MPFYCSALGCRNKNSPGCAMFLFPSDQELNLKWRVNMNRGRSLSDRHTLWKSKKYSKLCQEHFTDDCFVISPRLAAEIGYSVGRLGLKPDAVPTIFANGKSKCLQPRGAFQKRNRREVLRETLTQYEHQMTETHQRNYNEVNGESPAASADLPTSDQYMYTAVPLSLDNCDYENRVEDVSSSDDSNKKPRWRHKSSQTPACWKSKLPVPLKSSSCQTRVEKKDQCTQTDAEQIPTNRKVTTPAETMDDSFMSNNLDQHEDLTDSDYLPGMEFDQSDDEDEITEQTNFSKERKYIVFESNLKELLKVCRFCSVPANTISKRTTGTMVVFNTKCELCEHEFSWGSQPVDNRMPVGNLILSASILFSGASPVKTLNFLRFSRIESFGLRTYYNVQNLYLLPAINSVWERQQQDMIREVSGPLRLGGDARCCSPGHTAKYGSYSLMDLESSKVIDMQLVQCNEVANSNAMELEGLKRCLGKLTSEGIHVSDITTDRHPQVKKYLREKHPTINHWFDVWHVAKGVKKKIELASKRKGCDVLGRWSHSLSNHLYYCAASSEGNGELVVAKWKSVLNHVANIHEGHSPLFPSCLHGPLEDREWIKNGSKPHKELTEVVERQGLIRDIKKLSPSEQTYSLESFHKICCFFATKFVHFFFCSMEGRLKLACLHFNENSNRDQSTNKDGTLRWQVSKPKYRHGNAVAKEVKTPITYNYVDLLMDQLFERRSELHSYRECREDLKPMLESTPKPVCSRYEAVDKNLIIQAHRSRFSSLN